MRSLGTQIHPPPRPIVFVALALIAGLVAGRHGSIAPAWPAALAVLALGWSGYWFVRARRIHGPAPRAGRALLLVFFGIGCWQGLRLTEQEQSATSQMQPWITAQAQCEPVCIEGTLTGEPKLKHNAVEMVLRQVTIRSLRVGGSSARLPLDILLSARERAAWAMMDNPRALPWPGQKVRAWGRLKSLSASTAPGAFDAARYWLNQSVGARMSVLRPADVELGEPPTGPQAALFRLIRTTRKGIIRTLNQRLGREEAGLARALLLGESHLLSQDDHDAFQLTGLAHLWAVSGLKAAFILALALGLCRVAGLSTVASSLAACGALVFYAALTGFEPPVVRALVMAFFLLGGMCLKRVTTSLASLALAALVSLLFDPHNILRVDWQLTYGCVLAVIVMTPPMHDLFRVGFQDPPDSAKPKRLSRWSWARLWFGELLLMPLATMLAVSMLLIPLQIVYFGQFNLLSPLHNAIGVGLAMLSMHGILATAILGWIPGLGAAAGWATDWLLRLLFHFVRFAASIPLTIYYYRPLPLPVLAVYCAILFSGSWLRRGDRDDLRLGRKQAFNLVLTMLALAALIAWSPLVNMDGGRNRGTLDFYVLDIGQGDGLVLRFPDERIMVVDAGNFQPVDKGRTVVGPFLHALGAQTIDCMVATHADSDHVGGLLYLIDHFKVGQMLISPHPGPSNIYQTLRAVAERRGIRQTVALEGQELKGFEPARIQLLGALSGMEDNNASVVLLLTYGQVKLLLTGDLEAKGERRIIADGLSQPIDLLKVGHHGSGSATSEEFLQAFQPKAGLISVGLNNRYGHPNKDVLQRLTAHRIPYFRTDLLGSLWARTDGRQIQIYHYAGEE